MTAATKPQSTAVARHDAAHKGDIRVLLQDERVRDRIAPFLPPGTDYDRVVAAVYYAGRQNPAILKCTPSSIIDAVARVQQWGLEIGVTAHLVPFGDKCNAIADYTGIAELMVASGAVRHVETRTVYEHDEFRYRYGLEPELYHVPTSDIKARGPIVAAYCILRLPFGASSFEVMAAEDIEAIRQRYSKQWKGGPLPSWYARKTVVRQASKLIPKNRKLASVLRVIREDEDQEFGQIEPPPDAEARADFRELEADARQRQLQGVRNITTAPDLQRDVKQLGRVHVDTAAAVDLFGDEMTDMEIAERDAIQEGH